jgi:hypothetical protein
MYHETVCISSWFASGSCIYCSECLRSCKHHRRRQAAACSFLIGLQTWKYPLYADTISIFLVSVVLEDTLDIANYYAYCELRF